MEVSKNKRLGFTVNNLKQVREKLNVQCSELATRTGLHQNHLWRVEGGRCGLGGDAMTAIVEYLGCTPNDLIYPIDDLRMAQIRLGFLQKRLAEAKRDVLELQRKN